MKSTMKQISLLLEPTHTKPFLFHRSTEAVYDLVDYTPDIKETEPQILYITDYKNLINLLYDDQPLNILCFNAPCLDCPSLLKPQCNLILTTDLVSAADLFARYQCHQPQTDYSQQLLSALPDRDLRELCRITSVHFLNPVIICNPLFETVAFESYFQTDARLNQYIDNNILKEPFRRTFDNNHSVHNFDQETKTNYSCSVVSNSDIPLFYILIIEKNTFLTENEVRELSSFNTALAIYYHMKPKGDVEFQFMHEYFLIKLIEGDQDRHSLNYRAKLLEIALKKYNYIIVVNSLHENSVPSLRLRQYAQSFRQLFPGIAAIYKNLIVILYTSDQDTFSDYALESFRKLLVRHNLYAGISNCFEDFSASKKYFRQALEAISQGTIAPFLADRIFFFSKLLPYRLMSTLPGYTSLEECIAPCVQKLIKYDKEHKTDFTDTMNAYVQNVCNVTKTAADLHMHRNTLVYRIKKIEEITGTDFSSGEALLNILFSFKALELIKHGKSTEVE